LAALAGGLACGTKYPGGLLLPFVLGAAVVISIRTNFRFKSLVARAMKVGGVFALAYLLSTPGTVLEPGRFWRDVHFEHVHYKTLGHGGYTVDPGVGHLRKVLEYLALDALSPYDGIGLVLFGAAVFGWGNFLWGKRWRWAILIGGFLVAYLGFFAEQRVMVVRNYLIIVPFMAIFAAHGIAVSTSLLRPQWAKVGWGALWCGLVAINLWGVSEAAGTIGNPPKVYADAFRSYVRANPAATFLASPKTAPLLAPGLPNVKPLSADNVAGDWNFLTFYGDEWGDPLKRPSNLRNAFVAEFGPKEVNYGYYTTWLNGGRILVVTKERARELRVAVLEAYLGRSVVRAQERRTVKH
jgi:hypothetical protein